MQILNVKRLVAIVIIFAATAAAWFVLAGVINQRTRGLDTRLRSKVTQSWGSRHEQTAASINFVNDEPVTEKIALSGGRSRVITHTPRTIFQDVPVASSVDVKLKYNPRQKGLLWYNLFKADFTAAYTMKNTKPKRIEASLSYTFPDPSAVYDNFSIKLDGEPLETKTVEGSVRAIFKIQPGAERVVTIHYEAQGADEWRYAFASVGAGGGVKQVKDFTLAVTTDFKDVDFPDQTLPPTTKVAEGDGWKLGWEYTNLIAGKDIAVKVPQKLNPGPFVQRVTVFAPVALFFFFFVLLMIMVLRKIPLHPMHFFFLAAGFFSFHLLFAYLVDHFSLMQSFVASSVVALALTISYLRLVVGARFALLEAGVSELVFLVAFTYSFFFEGYTGLTITILAIATLFVMMQLTGRVNWSQVFEKK